MVDLFEDVESELRTEQYKRIGLKLLPWVIGLVVGVVVIGGGYLGYSAWQDSRNAKASDAYSSALEVLLRGDNEGAFNAFGEIAATGTPIYKAFSLNQQAGIRLAQGRKPDAVALFDKAAEAAPKTKEGLIFADLSRLKSAWTLLDEASLEDIEARLTPLTQPDRPFRAMAQEAIAWSKLKAGKTAEARSAFLTLSTALDAPQGVTTRASDVVRALDTGNASTLPQVVAAIKALPPPSAASQLSPEMLQQLMQAVQQQGAAAQ